MFSFAVCLSNNFFNFVLVSGAVKLIALVMSDPVLEFLAREQNVLAGIEDDSLGTSPPPYSNNTGSNEIADNGTS